MVLAVVLEVPCNGGVLSAKKKFVPQHLPLVASCTQRKLHSGEKEAREAEYKGCWQRMTIVTAKRAKNFFAHGIVMISSEDGSPLAAVCVADMLKAHGWQVVGGTEESHRVAVSRNSSGTLQFETRSVVVGGIMKAFTGKLAVSASNVTPEFQDAQSAQRSALCVSACTRLRVSRNDEQEIAAYFASPESILTELQGQLPSGHLVHLFDSDIRVHGIDSEGNGELPMSSLISGGDFEAETGELELGAEAAAPVVLNDFAACSPAAENGAAVPFLQSWDAVTFNNVEDVVSLREALLDADWELSAFPPCSEIAPQMAIKLMYGLLSEMM